LQELFIQILYCERVCIRHRFWHKVSLSRGFSCSCSMLSSLSQVNKKLSIQTVGFIHFGHQSHLMRAHRPIQYTTRITESRVNYTLFSEMKVV
jgi:hypothetical protein